MSGLVWSLKWVTVSNEPGDFDGHAEGRHLSVASQPSCSWCLLKVAGHTQRLLQHAGRINPCNTWISTDTNRQTTTTKKIIKYHKRSKKKNHKKYLKKGLCASNKTPARQSWPQVDSITLPWEGEGGFSLIDVNEFRPININSWNIKQIILFVSDKDVI